MQFLALIYAGEGKDDVDMETLISQYESFEEEAKNVVLGSNALEAVSTATSVRVRDGKSHLTDGPFAETKEQLGGYYLFDCKDLGEALLWAAKIPSARYGTVEVRPVMLFD
ncbi:MAG: YciI family protein [Paraglaciecola sp.]|uniref:YciI family protein n=1 Tax=Paraglaciecola sp. TaxID=1920173 RepID=UPI003297289D